MVLDGRSETGRRIGDFAESFAAALGGWAVLTDMQAANVRKAAELSALAEQSRAEALRNGCDDPVGLARLDGVASRAVRALGLPKAVPRNQEADNLGAYLAHRYGDDQTNEAAGEAAGALVGVAATNETLTSELPDKAERRREYQRDLMRARRAKAKAERQTGASA